VGQAFAGDHRRPHREESVHRCASVRPIAWASCSPSSELEKENVETSTCIEEIQTNISKLPAGDPERVGASRLIRRLMEARIVADRTTRFLMVPPRKKGANQP
jgi:hypothetical protein